MRIMIGMTGSVATTIAPKIVLAIAEGVPNCDAIDVVMTEKAQMFQDAEQLARETGAKVYTERNEWIWAEEDKTEHTYEDGHTVVLPRPEKVFTDKWRKGMPILHVEMAKRSACLVIAPASMNTIAKMAHGITDNLLTSVYSAWDTTRPVIIAPACNTRMWTSKQNLGNIEELARRGVRIIPPVIKKLACGDIGDGALADARVIASYVASQLEWSFPIQLDACPGIPVGKHIGSFGAVRRHGKHHCGIDLYCQNGTPVYAVEPGTVVAIDGFTGASVGSPWWNETQAVKVEGASGVVCYGEIEPNPCIKVGYRVGRSDQVGYVKQVLMDGQLRPDIPGHSLSMLHLQLYVHGMVHKDESWLVDNPAPAGVLDPTPFLLPICGSLPRLDMP